MKVTEIRYEKLVSTGSFSHAKGGVTLQLDEGDSSIEAFAMARRLVKSQINEETERQEDLRPLHPPPTPYRDPDDDGVPF